MEFIFDLPHVFTPDASLVDNALVLNTLLECLIAIDMQYLRTHTVPTLYKSGVRYAKTKEWLPIPALYKSKKGDCKSLTAALVAEYRLHGVNANPVFRFAERKNGSEILDFHILVEINTGFTDPSKILGMPHSELAKFGTY